jgi:hypothetical protein
MVWANHRRRLVWRQYLVGLERAAIRRSPGVCPARRGRNIYLAAPYVVNQGSRYIRRSDSLGDILVRGGGLIVAARAFSLIDYATGSPE